MLVSVMTRTGTARVIDTTESVSGGDNIYSLPAQEVFMRRSLLLIVSIIAIVWILPGDAFGQGHGRGIGLGRRSDVFVNSRDGRNGRFHGLGPQIGSRWDLVVPRNR